PASSRALERAREPRLPRREQRGEPCAEALVHVRQLGGEVAHHAAAHAVALALRLHHAVQEAANLSQRRRARVGEAWLQRPIEEPVDNLVEDGVTEVFLALEVV